MTPNDFRLLADRVLVDPDDRPTESESGLIVFPQVAYKDNPDHFAITGTVVKLGQGVRADRFRCTICGHVFDQASGPRGDCTYCHAAMRGTNVELLEAGQLAGFSVKVGDRVTFNRFAGNQLELDTETGSKRFLVMRDHEIEGIFDDGSTLRQKATPIKVGTMSDGVTPTHQVQG